MEFIEKNRKKIFIGIIVLLFLALVGVVQVIRVVGGNISKSISGETKTDTEGNITSLSSSDAKKIVDDAEKELTSKTGSQMRAEKEASINAMQTKLPISDIISDNNFDYKNTIGVKNINGNYYVGYNCGLKEVWNAADKAQTNAIMLNAMVESGEDKTSVDYQNITAKIKSQTPYIKEVQDMDMRTVEPRMIIEAINKYMQDTVRMNCRNISRQFYFKLENNVFGTNENFRRAMNKDGSSNSFVINDAIDYLNTLPADKYPALNVELR